MVTLVASPGGRRMERRSFPGGPGICKGLDTERVDTRAPTNWPLGSLNRSIKDTSVEVSLVESYVMLGVD